jgi:energy-coupling factor transporter ATP-binding protein EcfA2
MLDDPIQNMDDLNILGLLDMLRNLPHDRQLVISTHDNQILTLMESKLRPEAEGRSLRVYEFESYAEQGPIVARRDHKFVTMRLLVDQLTPALPN